MCIIIYPTHNEINALISVLVLLQPPSQAGPLLRREGLLLTVCAHAKLLKLVYLVYLPAWKACHAHAVQQTSASKFILQHKRHAVTTSDQQDHHKTHVITDTNHHHKQALTDPRLLSIRCLIRLIIQQDALRAFTLCVTFYHNDMGNSGMTVNIRSNDHRSIRKQCFSRLRRSPTIFNYKEPITFQPLSQQQLTD